MTAPREHYAAGGQRIGFDGAILPRYPVPDPRRVVRARLPFCGGWCHPPPLDAAAVADVSGGTWLVVLGTRATFGELVDRARRQNEARRREAWQRLDGSLDFRGPWESRS